MEKIGSRTENRPLKGALGGRFAVVPVFLIINSFRHTGARQPDGKGVPAEEHPFRGDLIRRCAPLPPPPGGRCRGASHASAVAEGVQPLSALKGSAASPGGGSKTSVKTGDVTVHVSRFHLLLSRRQRSPVDPSSGAGTKGSPLLSVGMSIFSSRTQLSVSALRFSRSPHPYTSGSAAGGPRPCY